MATGNILNPTAVRSDDITSPGPDAGPLANKVIGIRLDEIWRAWDWVAEVWADKFRAAGAEVIFWRSHQGRTGAEGEKMTAALDAFLDNIDVAVVGLGNCGSCTGWTIRDALTAAQKGLPTTAICTEAFKELGHQLAAAGGRSGLRIHILPYPLNEKERNEVEPVGHAYYESVLQTMGATTQTVEVTA